MHTSHTYRGFLAFLLEDHPAGEFRGLCRMPLMIYSVHGVWLFKWIIIMAMVITCLVNLVSGFNQPQK